MRILGIDPGYGRLGIAIVEYTRGADDRIIFSSCFETDPTKDFPSRLHDVITELRKVVACWSPEHCALEKLYFQKNKKTAMRVSEARGAIIALMTDLGVSITEVSPQEVKIAITGNGNATKADIARLLPRLVQLPHIPTHDDEYDAIAAGITARCLSTRNASHT